MSKPALTIEEQILLLKRRGMKFRSVEEAPHFLANIGYHRLKAYWWEMQSSYSTHSFTHGSYFEDAVYLYNFDRRFRLIIFNAIERIEIALRTKLIYHFSLSYGPFWYNELKYFNNYKLHLKFISILCRDISTSKEEFIKKHYKDHSKNQPESWKTLELITLGALSKLYDNIHHQLPEKTKVAHEFGLYNQKYLASWLLSITVVRNIIAHHGRLWNREVINKYQWPDKTLYPILRKIPTEKQRQRIFPLLSAILYMNDRISPKHQIRDDLFKLFADLPNFTFRRMGFYKDWRTEPIWKLDKI